MEDDSDRAHKRRKLLVNAILIVGMLVTGSINTLSKSAQNNSRQVGLDKTFYCWQPDGNKNLTQFRTRDSCLHNCTTCEWTNERNFDAPWFQTLVMFTGEAIALLALLAQRRSERREGELKPLMGRPPEAQPKIFQAILLLPTFCDLAGTTLAGIGLIYVYASVWQMLRGSIIVFTGIFSVVFLKRTLKLYNWLGMFVAVIGLFMVGLASILSVSQETGQTAHTTKETVLGIAMIVAAQVASATQMVIEETYVKGRRLPPLQVVGVEGVYGMLLMIFVVLPTVYFIPGDQPSHFKQGSYENSLDAAVMIGNNMQLLGFCLLYLFSITFYNFCGLAVTKHLSAVHRTLIDACRTLLVWTVDLLIRYGFKEDGFGEAWTSWSLRLQLPGFLVLVLGTLLYNNVIAIPALNQTCGSLFCGRPSEPHEAEQMLINPDEYGAVKTVDVMLEETGATRQKKEEWE